MFCYVTIYVMQFKAGKNVMGWVINKSEAPTNSDKDVVMQYKDQRKLTEKINEIKLLIYFYLPSGLITFILQIIDDYIVYEEHVTDGLVMVRNIFELLPVIILIWVFKEKT